MSRYRLFGLLVVALLVSFSGVTLVVGCGGADTQTQKQRAPQPQRESTQVYFAYPSAGTFTTKDFYQFPYPHDIRLDKDGTPALAGFPTPARAKQCAPIKTNQVLIDNLIKSIDPDEYVTDIAKVTDTQTKGFSVNPAITFRFTRSLDKGSIPPLAATVSAGSSVFLVDIDDASPDKGKRVPLRIRVSLKSRFLPTNTLILRPLEGFVLRSNTTYAAVVTTAVRDAESWPLSAHPLWQKIAGTAALERAEDKALRTHYAPLLSYLKTVKLSPEEIAAATVFTTGDPTAQLQAMRTFIREKVMPPAAPTTMTCSNNAASTPYITCIGRHAAPIFQKGDAPFLGKTTGFFEFDEKGEPKHRMTSLRFALTIPKRYADGDAVRDRPLPIVMYAHGTGGTYRTVINNGTARRLANMGIATFGIDQAVNGERTTELAGTRLDFLFFNALNLPSARDNVRQSALDYFWQVRYLKFLTVKHEGQTFSFDQKRFWFMGHSQGGLTGPLVLAFEDDIQSAYLSAPGGFIINTLLHKTKPTEPILLTAVLDYMLCEPDGDRIDVFHPILGLVQHFFDGADPVSYSPRVLSGKRTPLNLLMTEGLTDGYAPPQVFEPLAIAMGLPLLGPNHSDIPGLRLRSLPTYKLPIRGNMQHASGALVTAGFTQHKECKYASGSVCDGHFVAFYNPDAQRNWISFFQSLVYDNTAQIH